MNTKKSPSVSAGGLLAAVRGLIERVLTGTRSLTVTVRYHFYSSKPNYAVKALERNALSKVTSPNPATLAKAAK